MRQANLWNACEERDNRLPDNLNHGARRSQAISIARVICILGVVYVHAWTGLSGYDLELARGSVQEDLRWVLMEIFGHSAVPLLGLISGWLVAGSRTTLQWRIHLRRKARTILVPMVLWNALAVLLVSGSAWLWHLPAPTPDSVRWVVEEIFIVTRNPDINVQMPFLRDLFLCMVLAPLLVRMPSRALAVLAMGAAFCQIFGFGPPVFMRAAIPFFFILGILAQRGGMAERVAKAPLAWSVLPFALLMPVQLYLSLRLDGRPVDFGTSALDLAVRVAAAAAYWRLSWALAGSVAKDALLKMEPYVFLLFCSHLILIWLGGPVLGALFGKLGAPLYPVYLVAQPLIVLGAVVVVGTLLARTVPGPARLLSGGRLRAA